jgi:hypothetical protein
MQRRQRKHNHVHKEEHQFAVDQARDDRVRNQKPKLSTGQHENRGCSKGDYKVKNDSESGCAPAAGESVRSTD